MIVSIDFMCLLHVLNNIGFLVKGKPVSFVTYAFQDPLLIWHQRSWCWQWLTAEQLLPGQTIRHALLQLPWALRLYFGSYYILNNIFWLKFSFGFNSILEIRFLRHIPSLKNSALFLPLTGMEREIYKRVQNPPMYANPSVDQYTFNPDLEMYKFLICGVCRTILSTEEWSVEKVKTSHCGGSYSR